MSEVSEVARRLKELLEQAGLTMRSVSDALGWSLTRRLKKVDFEEVERPRKRERS